MIQVVWHQTSVGGDFGARKHGAEANPSLLRNWRKARSRLGALENLNGMRGNGGWWRKNRRSGPPNLGGIRGAVIEGKEAVGRIGSSCVEGVRGHQLDPTALDQRSGRSSKVGGDEGVQETEPERGEGFFGCLQRRLGVRGAATVPEAALQARRRARSVGCAAGRLLEEFGCRWRWYCKDLGAELVPEAGVRGIPVRRALGGAGKALP